MQEYTQKMLDLKFFLIDEKTYLVSHCNVKKMLWNLS